MPDENVSHVYALIKKAAEPNTLPGASMQLAQAALNAAHALLTLSSIQK